MDETKHLEEVSFDQINGSEIQFTIKASKETDGSWVAIGKAKFLSTRDQEHWGEIELSAKSFDSDPNSATGTVMMSIINYVNSKDFDDALFSAILKAEQGE